MFRIWYFRSDPLYLIQHLNETEIMNTQIKLASATDIYEAIKKFGYVWVSFDGGFSSTQFKDFAYFTGILNQHQERSKDKIFFDHQEKFRPNYFQALNGVNLPDLSNDKSLD